MSSIRNSVKRIAHKERSQPADRKKYGLLEKHKDYVLRARDFHRKEDAIKVLKEKALNRNPDEFYFKMEKSQTVDGVHQGRVQDPSKYTQDELLLMKTQDLRYVLNKAQAETRKLERLQSSLHMIGREEKSNTHVVFREEEEGKEEGESGNGLEEVLGEISDFNKPLPKRLEKKRAVSYRELREREGRVEKLKKVMLKMTMQKELMGKGRKRKLRSDEKEETHQNVYLWKRERKR